MYKTYAWKTAESRHGDGLFEIEQPIDRKMKIVVDFMEIKMFYFIIRGALVKCVWTFERQFIKSQQF